MSNHSSTASQPIVDRADFVHTGPGTLAGRYIRQYWQPIFESAKLPKGKIVPIKILGENLALYRRIEEQGAILSEFPLGRRADKQSFAMRNRIVAGSSAADTDMANRLTGSV